MAKYMRKTVLGLTVRYHIGMRKKDMGLGN